MPHMLIQIQVSQIDSNPLGDEAAPNALNSIPQVLQKLQILQKIQIKVLHLLLKRLFTLVLLWYFFFF